MLKKAMTKKLWK